MAETDTGVAAGGLGKVIGDAVIAFNHTNVMLPLVTSKQAVKGAITVQFPDYTKVASSSVAAVSDGADHSTVASITTAARSATVSEHVIRADVSVKYKGKEIGFDNYIDEMEERVTRHSEGKSIKKLTGNFSGFGKGKLKKPYKTD